VAGESQGLRVSAPSEPVRTRRGPARTITLQLVNAGTGALSFRVERTVAPGAWREHVRPAAEALAGALAPGDSLAWPVEIALDPGLPADAATLTVDYSFSASR
jgi:hypothetical protein